MRTIGQHLKQARIKKKLTQKELEKETKIKGEFIRALEKERWEKLPEFPVVSGFVKNLSSSLKINQKHALALLRRDYLPKKEPASPKPDVAEKLGWSPRLTFLLGILSIIILTVGYLIIQYAGFISPPALSVDNPGDGSVIEESTLWVSGLTDPEATVKVNNQPVLVSEDGSFTAEIEVFEGTEEVVIIARSRSGKETRVVRKIEVKLE